VGKPEGKIPLGMNEYVINCLKWKKKKTSNSLQIPLYVVSRFDCVRMQVLCIFVYVCALTVIRNERNGQLENLRLFISKGCKDASPLPSLHGGRGIKTKN
jgi:hypothetical protein